MDSDLEVQILFPTASHSAAPTRVADHYLMKPAEPHDLQKGGMRFWGHQSKSLPPSGYAYVQNLWQRAALTMDEVQ